MKLKKKIAAVGAAVMMAVSTMSIVASAYSEGFHLNKNNPYFSKNVTVSNRTQKLYLSSFSRSSGSNASVTMYNHISSTLKKTWSSAPQSYSETVPVSALGTTVTIEAYLNNYASASYVYADGTFTG